MLESVALLVALSIGMTVASADGVEGQRRWVDPSRYSCGTGRIRNVQSVTETVTVRAAWPRPTGSAESVASLPLESERTRRYFVITVRFGDEFHLIRASADASWNLDPTTFRFDEPIAACVNAAEMVLDRLNGTDFRGRVIRVQHDEAPFVPPDR